MNYLRPTGDKIGQANRPRAQVILSCATDRRLQAASSQARLYDSLSFLTPTDNGPHSGFIRSSPCGPLSTEPARTSSLAS